MAKTGDDCYFFYFQTCVKGAACPFRHVEEARPSDVTCEEWRLGRCRALPCPKRHMELQKNTPCYFETQPGGCTKPNCPFLHKLSQNPSVLTTSAPASLPMSQPPARLGAPPGPWTSAGPPPLSSAGQLPPGAVWPRPLIPPPNMFPGIPVSGPPRVSVPRFPPYGPPVPGPMMGHGHMVQIEPVIINPNEESDQDSIKGSPMKPVVKIQPKSDNPLDYFLNAKPWVDPNPSVVRSRSPSPRRFSPARREDSLSPRRSESPDHPSRRRSVSADRYERRRSGSLDRSRSPEWRDRRRFVRRSSRSPPRRRSPDRGRSGGILNRFRTDPRGPRLEEVKVTGPKVISIRKTKTDSEQAQEEEKEKEEKKSDQPQTDDRSKLTTSKSVPVLEEEVKSLEDIYRERALLSLMEAKRKKILENKRKRWEKVTESKKSESEKSDKSEDTPAVDEKGDKPEEKEDSSSDSADEEEKNSDMELPDDIDIELGEGELESDHEQEEAGDTREVQPAEQEAQDQEKARPIVNIPGKPSIKSRLGLKAVEQLTRQAAKDRLGNLPAKPRSVKDRLGLKTDIDKPLRSGVIKLTRDTKAEDVMSRIRINRDLRANDGKNILMVPKITIKNRSDIEERKADLKQRLGFLYDDDENSNDSKKGRRKKRTIDEELIKLLRDEEADIDEDDLDLLSKKEKKKLLKRLLAQQGREEEYEEITRRRKKKRRKERVDEEGDRDVSRRINVESRSAGRRKDDVEEYGEEGDLQSEEEEIVLEETTVPEQAQSPETEEKTEADVVTGLSEDQKPQRSVAELRREREEKEARLREALEPKTLDDIRRERAVKRATGDGSMRISTGQNKRRIVMGESEEEKKVEPPIKVTFDGVGDSGQLKRKLIRLGGSREQNENTRPLESRSAREKRERQIYVPPRLKRIEVPEKKSSEVTSRLGGPPPGREIVDYGDMFPKFSASPEKKTTVRLTTSASESDLSVRLPLKLQRGPPKVEVKDANVKTFAEIMAEKKRKRMLAQQGKPSTCTPVSEDESASQSSIPEDRMSPVLSDSQTTTAVSSATSSPTRTALGDTSLQMTEKPTRWKRRKLSNPDTSANVKSQELNIIEEQNSPLIEEEAEVLTPETQGISDNGNLVKSGDQNDDIASEISSTSLQDAAKSKPDAEKSKKSDSFMDFDDDLLDIEGDSDFELEGAHQDPDELMREIDELLA